MWKNILFSSGDNTSVAFDRLGHGFRRIVIDGDWIRFRTIPVKKCLRSPSRSLPAGHASTAASTRASGTRGTTVLETDVPGQEFLKLTVSGTAIPAVEVQPRREVYLGRLEAGKPQTVSFRLAPAKPEMKLRLLPADASDYVSQLELVQEDDGTYRLELHVQPDASRRFVLVQRQIAIDWQEEALPPLRIKIRFTVQAKSVPGGSR